MKYHKVLILGANGTLGRALKQEFNNKHYEVVAWDRKEADITSVDFSIKIKTTKPELIINATGYNAVDRAEKEEKEMAHKINAEAVSIMASTAKEIGAVFVNYSTGYVFSGKEKMGYVEESIPSQSVSMVDQNMQARRQYKQLVVNII